MTAPAALVASRDRRAGKRAMWSSNEPRVDVSIATPTRSRPPGSHRPRRRVPSAPRRGCPRCDGEVAPQPVAAERRRRPLHPQQSPQRGVQPVGRHQISRPGAVHHRHRRRPGSRRSPSRCSMTTPAAESGIAHGRVQRRTPHPAARAVPEVGARPRCCRRRSGCRRSSWPAGSTPRSSRAERAPGISPSPHALSTPRRGDRER